MNDLKSFALSVLLCHFVSNPLYMTLRHQMGLLLTLFQMSPGNRTLRFLDYLGKGVLKNESCNLEALIFFACINVGMLKRQIHRKFLGANC